jgi:hypothetical protein
LLFNIVADDGNGSNLVFAARRAARAESCVAVFSWKFGLSKRTRSFRSLPKTAGPSVSKKPGCSPRKVGMTFFPAAWVARLARGPGFLPEFWSLRRLRWRFIR